MSARRSLVMVSGAVLLLATAAVAARIAERVFRSAAVGTATFALVAFNYALVFWTLRGMEVGLLALLMTLALGLTLSVEARAEAHRPRSAPLVWLCLTLALADTTRREASLLHLIVMLAHGVDDAGARAHRRTLGARDDAGGQRSGRSWRSARGTTAIRGQTRTI